MFLEKIKKSGLLEKIKRFFFESTEEFDIDDLFRLYGGNRNSGFSINPAKTHLTPGKEILKNININELNTFIGVITVDLAAKFLVSLIYVEPILLKHFSLKSPTNKKELKQSSENFNLAHQAFKDTYSFLFKDGRFIKMWHAAILYFLTIIFGQYKLRNLSDDIMNNLADLIMINVGMKEDFYVKNIGRYSPEEGCNTLQTISTQLAAPIFGNDIEKNTEIAVSLATDNFLGTHERMLVEHVKPLLNSFTQG